MARVLSTRTPKGEFMVIRRLQCLGEFKHRFNTVEVLETFFMKQGKSRREKHLAQNRAGAERRRKASEKRVAIKALYEQGKSYNEIAAELGIGYASVAQHVRKLIDGGHVVRRKGNDERDPLRTAIERRPASDWTGGLLGVRGGVAGSGPEGP